MTPSPLIRTALPDAEAVRILFERFRHLRVLVVGDLMLDRYLWGKVSRISPEAPVPVVDVHREDNRLGGAANVGMNLRALGIEAVLCGAIGTDRDGEIFRQVVQECDLPDYGLLNLTDRRTTAKIRVIGNNQQMLRVDREDSSPLAPAQAQLVLDHVMRLLSEHRFDALIFEDYDKGLLSKDMIEQITRNAQNRGIPVMVDPKFRNFFSYQQSTVFKPNVKELNEALGTSYDRGDIEGLKAGVSQLAERMPHQQTMVTLSEHGVLVRDAKGAFHHLPAHIRQIVDVSGAGDTVISVLTACMAAGVQLPAAAAIANLAGGLVCESVGVVPIDPSRLQLEVLEHLRNDD